MKKQLLALAVGLVLMSGSVFAMEAETLVGLAGSGTGPTGRFFFPVVGDTDLVLGFKGAVPGEKSRELEYTVQAGVAMDVPFLGRHNILVDISNLDRSGNYQSGRALEFGVITIQKDYLFNLTDQLKLGFTLNLLTVDLRDGQKSATLLQSITPVLGANLKLVSF